MPKSCIVSGQELYVVECTDECNEKMAAYTTIIMNDTLTISLIYNPNSLRDASAPSARFDVTNPARVLPINVILKKV